MMHAQRDTKTPYGLPLVCPKCPKGVYFGMLKVPGNKAVPCPNCHTQLVARRAPPVLEREG